MPYFYDNKGFSDTFHIMFPTQEEWTNYWRNSPYFVELNTNSANFQLIKETPFDSLVRITQQGDGRSLAGETTLALSQIQPEPVKNALIDDTGLGVSYSTKDVVVFATIKSISATSCIVEYKSEFQLAERQIFTVPKDLIFPALTDEDIIDSQGRPITPEVRYKGKYVELYSKVIGVDGDTVTLSNISSTRLNEFNFYWAMIATYGNWNTRYMDNEVFKGKLSFVLQTYGPYYYERLKQIQNQLRLTLAQYADDGETIQNTAYNPANDTIDTDSAAGLGYVNNQNRYKRRTGESDAMRKKYQMAMDRDTEEFFARFNDLFAKIITDKTPDYQYFVPERNS
jgi:hypothetical protein